MHHGLLQFVSQTLLLGFKFNVQLSLSRGLHPSQNIANLDKLFPTCALHAEMEHVGRTGLSPLQVQLPSVENQAVARNHNRNVGFTLCIAWSYQYRYRTKPASRRLDGDRPTRYIRNVPPPPPPPPPALNPAAISFCFRAPLRPAPPLRLVLIYLTPPTEGTEQHNRFVRVPLYVALRDGTKQQHSCRKR